MTKFTSINVGTHGAPGGEKNYVTIETSGTSQFDAPIRSGPLGSQGLIMVTQRATITSQNSAGEPVSFLLPNGSNIVDITADIESPIIPVLVTAQRFFVKNNSAAATAGNTISEVGVSASGRYDLLSLGNVDHSRLRNQTIVEVFTSTKALASAAVAGQGMVTITYIQTV